MSSNDEDNVNVCNNEESKKEIEAGASSIEEVTASCQSEEKLEKNDVACAEMEDDKGAGESGKDAKNICPEMIDFKVVWNKNTFAVSFDLNKTVEELKEHIKELTGIPGNMQKLMYKGLIKDHSVTLREAKISKGIKLMVVGSTLKDVLTVTPPNNDKTKDSKTSESVAASKEPLSNQKMHKKIIEKGMPDDVMPGIKGAKERLPPHPLSGMLNKRAGKVRLTFKLELDQLWLGTKDRTEKLPMTSIRNVISEPIDGHEQYHIMALQLGPTEASRYWIYWVPAQYVDAIKDAVLGRWQAF